MKIQSMKAIDSILALLGLTGFAGFLAIIGFYVQEPVLVLIFVICTAMAAFDFARDLFSKR